MKAKPSVKAVKVVGKKAPPVSFKKVKVVKGAKPLPFGSKKKR